MSEASEKSSAGENSVANHPIELGTERVGEEGERGEAHVTSVDLQWGALSKQMSRKREAKQRHSLAGA